MSTAIKERTLDYQRLFNKIGIAQENVGIALKACEGMEAAAGELEENKFSRLADGVYGLLVLALDKTFTRMEALQGELEKTCGRKYPCSMDKAEEDAYYAERGRWI